jgi:hypothetical protein
VDRYLFSLVRCVPDPRTGEFVNVAAIAGDPSTGDWSIRQVSNESHVRKLAGAVELGAVHGFLARIGMQIDHSQSNLLEDSDDIPGEDWLQRLYHDHRNVVQLSPPTPIAAESAEDALDIIFTNQIIDPVTQGRREKVLTKQRALHDLREAYQRANISPQHLRRKVDLLVGEHVHTSLDYAVANGTTVQLAQGWSFQGARVDNISEQVKSWAYALRCLRDGIESRIFGSDEWVSNVASDVDLEVIVIPPLNAAQTEVFQESEQVFAQLNASVHSLNDVDAVGSRAAVLLGQSGPRGRG